MSLTAPVFGHQAAVYHGRPRASARRTFRLRDWLTFPLILWGMLWLSINTGPWNIPQFGAGLSANINAVRATLPLLVLAAALITLGATRRRIARSWAEVGFWIYGAVMLLACTMADRWFYQAYWGFAFLAALAVVEKGLRSRDPIEFAKKLNWFSWIMTIAALSTMLFLARDVLMGESGSAYGLVNRFQQAYGYGISRSTGLARMAAVPAIIALVFIVSRKGIWIRVASFCLLAGSLYILWIMQARGAIFSFGGGMAFVLLFGPRKLQKIWLLIIGGAVIYFLFASSQSGFQDFWLHITRGQGSEAFSTMSGRDAIFKNGIRHWLDAPLIGYGPQADRLFPDVNNAQNALLYALLSGGLLGAVFFLLAFVVSWIALLGSNLRYRTIPTSEREMMMITSGILVFSTLRSFPENQAALFSVDLLLQYPTMIYLTFVFSARRPRRSRQQYPLPLRGDFLQGITAGSSWKERRIGGARHAAGSYYRSAGDGPSRGA